MNDFEVNAFKFYERIAHREQIKSKSATLFKSKFRTLKNAKIYTEALKTHPTDKKMVKKLKKHLVECTYDEIKAQRDYKHEF
jgi:hypothetical protein